MLLLASGGRGTTLGMAVALVGAALVFGRRAWPWLRAQLLALGAGLGGYLLLFKATASTGVSITERSVGGGGRLQDWQEALTLTAGEPWLGIGPMHTAYLPNGLWPTTHNAPVQFVAEWGLPAGVIILALAVWGLWAWTRRARKTVLDAADSTDHKRFVYVALTGSLLAAGAHAWVSGVVVMPLSQVMMVLVLGWAWGLYHAKQPQAEHSEQAEAKAPGRWKQWMVAAFSLAAAGLVLWSCYPEALHTNMMMLEWVFESQRPFFAPRYWHQGIFGY